MENCRVNLLEEAVEIQSMRGKVILIEDCVETTASFILHHLIKQFLSSSSSDVIIFFAFSNPFSHYDRILRKLGCNLSAQKDDGRFFFFDMLMLGCADGKTGEDGFIKLFEKIQNVTSGLPYNYKNNVTIMIDDVSLMEVAAHGSSDHVLDFLHYCHTLTSDLGCSLVALNHGDIYSSMDRPQFILQMEYLADVLIKAEPLATGLAADVHGQLTVLNTKLCSGKGNLKNKICNFQFMIKENSVEYFYPGSRT